MSGDTLPKWFRSPPGRIGIYAPWPLVGVSMLLVALIIFTPVLVANSHQPGPGLLTQAELVVDKTASNSTVHFYVWALGEEIRYDAIRVGLSNSFSWAGSSPLNWSRLNWTSWQNGTDVLSVIVDTQANPVALNISAHYVSPSGSTWYVGTLAFFVSAATASSGESLYSASGTSGITVTSPLAVSNDTLPAVILLHNAGPGGVS
ncbi:MAG TPA: hypothetical protein VEG42_00750 [Thermoplasmata archaeon]|nr:hypothetical protein [Thermoplasmata archaeon]